jgi:hypothetical protein
LAEIFGALRGIVSIIDLLKHFLNKKVRLILESNAKTVRVQHMVYLLVIWKRIAEGTVQSVIENPPSIMLENVEESITFEACGAKFEQTGIQGMPTVRQTLPSKSTFKQKFYLMSAIKEVEPSEASQ